MFVVQADAGDDGMYIEYTEAAIVQDYVDFTAANGPLDSRCSIRPQNNFEEIEAVREWLSYPHVHLAIDPEFAVKEGEVPGQVLGQIDASTCG